MEQDLPLQQEQSGGDEAISEQQPARTDQRDSHATSPNPG
jgi:hypothetical protein